MFVLDSAKAEQIKIANDYGAEESLYIECGNELASFPLYPRRCSASTSSTVIPKMNMFSRPISSIISTFAPSKVPIVSAPFNCNQKLTSGARLQQRILPTDRPPGRSFSTKQTWHHRSVSLRFFNNYKNATPQIYANYGSCKRLEKAGRKSTMNFIFPVPDASVPAVEICSLRSAAGMIFSANVTR